MHYTLHKFRPGDTIDAVIRLKGRHDFTPTQIVEARVRFNEMNGSIVPRAGEVFKIPIPELVVDDFGDVIEVPKLVTEVVTIQVPGPTKPPEPVAATGGFVSYWWKTET